MAIFQLHPDNLIIIRDGEEEYIDTPENFQLDYGQSFDNSPTEILYEPGVRHFVDNEPKPLDWELGNTFIASLLDLIATKETRLEALFPPPPTQEELDFIEKITTTIPDEAKAWFVDNPAVLSLLKAPLDESEPVIMDWDLTVEADMNKLLKGMVVLLEVVRLLAYQQGLIKD